MLLCIQPIFKIVTAACLFSPLCSVCIRFCKSSLGMADILNGLRPLNIVLIACFNYGRPKFTIARGGHGYFSQSNAV